MKTAFLFAGQGAQSAGMGRDFYENSQASRRFMDALNLDFDVREVCFEDRLSRQQDTAYLQAAICAASLSIAAALEDMGIHPDMAAGLSLGEYSALACAEKLSLSDLFDLVRKRGCLMRDALPAGTTGMAAIVNPDIDRVREICREICDEGQLCSIANWNSPRQIVISGTSEGLQQAAARLKHEKMRVVPLNVAGAFHTSLLREAADVFYEDLCRVSFQEGRIPVFFNLTGRPESGRMPEIMSAQMCSPVQFTSSIQRMIQEGAGIFIEIGPGRSLSKFVRQIDDSVQSCSVNTWQDALDLAARLQKGECL